MSEQTITIDGTSSREMANDVVSITFHAMKTGKDASVVQTDLRTAVHEALETIRPHLVQDEVDVTTDYFKVEPTYGKSGKMDGYAGNATVTIKGTDTAKIAQLASDVKTMMVSSSRNSMSRKLRLSVEAELMEEAIADFRQKADAVTAAFGYKTWTIGSVHVSTSADRYGSGMSGKVMALGGSAMESAPMSIESGKSNMSGSVRGSIILSRTKKA